MQTIAVILDQAGRITKGPIITKTPEQAFQHFMDRICGGHICAQPIDEEDIHDELDADMLRRLENEVPKGFTLEHLAELGERNYSLKWKVYAIFIKTVTL